VAVQPSLENVVVLGLIVLIRTFLTFSLEVEIEGRWPWRRAMPVRSGLSTASSDTSELGESQPIEIRRRLCSVAGHLAGLRAWLTFDLGDPTAAHIWYEAALQPPL
jgi:hypothetical protein